MSANASPATALTEAEARARLARDGPNRLPSARHKTLPAAIVSAAAQPMVLLLLACTAVYALLGSAFDSAVLSVSILVVAGISVYLSLLPLLGGPLLLLPLHVVLLELIIDPACSLVFEAEPSPDDAMSQPPRPATMALFDASAVARALTVGASALVAVAAIQWGGHRAGWSDETLRLAALTSIIVANLAMLWWFRTGFTARQQTNRVFDALLLGVSLFYGVVLLVHLAERGLRVPDLGRAALDRGRPRDRRGVVGVAAAARAGLAAIRRLGPFHEAPARSAPILCLPVADT